VAWTRRDCLSLREAAPPPETPRETLRTSLLSARPRVLLAHVSMPLHEDFDAGIARTWPLSIHSTAFTLIFSKALLLERLSTGPNRATKKTRATHFPQMFFFINHASFGSAAAYRLARLLFVDKNVMRKRKEVGGCIKTFTIPVVLIKNEINESAFE